MSLYKTTCLYLTPNVVCFSCSLGLAVQYQTHVGSVFKYCRKLLALPFLPSDCLTATFEELSSQASVPELTVLVSYIRDTWISSEMWPPESWSCYRRSIRTNNDVEAWHARLGRQTGVGNLGVYQLSERLFDESKLVALSTKTMSEERIQRYQRLSTIRINTAVEKYYDEYDAGHRSAMRLLAACARVYGHSVGR